MRCLSSSVSRTAIACALAFAPAPVLAASFTVPTGSTNTTAQTLTGTQTGAVSVGGALSTTASSVTLGIATGTGVVLNNAGTISSGNRAIDTTSTVTGLLTVNNGGAITATDDGFRINGTLAGGTLLLSNSGTIVSSTGQALDFDKATATNAIVTITNSGSIQSSGSDAVRLGGGTISLSNSGTISTTSAGKRAIKFDTASNVDTLVSLSLNNGIGGLISGTDDAIKIAGNAGSTSAAVIAINNAGTIRSTAGGQGIDLGDLTSTSLKITITNQSTGLITASDNDGIKAGMNTVVSNYGTISSNYTTTSADVQNYSAVKFDGASGAVHNYAGGVISGAYHGIKASGLTDNIDVINDAGGTITGRNGSGVNSNGTGSVLNYGIITGSFDPAASFGDGDGVDIDHIGTIVNYGTIQALGSKGTKPGETKPSTSEGIAIGGGSITNGSATVRTALISGANNGILADDSNSGSIYGALTVTNYGTIQGLNGYGIQVVNNAGFATTITNYGTISGTTYAVAMGNGNDLFVYEAGSSVNGAVKGEGGTDTLRLGEVAGTFNLSLLGDSATYQGFEILDLAIGSGWTVTGSSSFSGATNVTGASLTLNNASLASSVVTVGGTNAVLAGTGTVGGLVANSGATISPGLTAGSIGTLSVNGAARFGSGSTYAVTVTNSGASDRIAVSGATTLSTGASVSVQAIAGLYNFRQTYTILTSAGGISGTFGPVSSNFAFLTPSLSYDANTVYLALNRNDTTFASVATTRNGRQAAAAVEAGGPNTALYNAVATGSITASQSAFQMLSGEAQASFGTTAFNQNQMVGDVIDARLRQSNYAGATGAAAGLGAGGPTAYANERAVKAGPFSSAVAPAPAPQAWTGWVQGYGQWNHLSGNGNASTLDSTVGGVLAGLDTSVNNWTLGFAAGYGWSNSSVANLGSQVNSDTAQFAFYAGTAFGALKLRAGATLAYSNVDSNRVVVVGSLRERPTASYDGWSGGFFGEAGYALPVGPVAFEPFAQLAWSGVNMGSFAETGAPVTGLSSSGLSFDTWYTTLGLRAAGAVSFAGYNIVPHASVGWRHAYGDVTPALAVTYLNTGTGFTVQGLPIAEDSAVLGAGLDLALGKGFTVGVSYDGAFASSSQSNAVRGTVGFTF
ncbi:outer membrane autotransporter protein [Azorhizobium sp. AG788]|uniref:autotransporter domain-containing protein n=1 Tax=Azorhizobium sp. AG788 TaxID=2183897 RepID=UPI00105CAB6C|nr:autotransporter domain-containing protein [Azorhizobium sp. AG788]TDT96877.1 outer membrane autotransporter protein [Azorhizobium sp. AG788]